jgi:single stranded DNA-binding protein
MKTTKNSGHVIGNLTADPKLRTTRSDQPRPVCNFIVATDELRKKPDGDGYESHTEYHHCVGWGPQAEHLHKRLQKGDLVSVEGPLRTRQNKTETTTYYNTTIEVRLWDLLHRPRPATDDSQEEEPAPGAG